MMNYGNVWALVGSLIAYVILAFVLPKLCVGKYFKDKDFAFEFFFYQCISNLYITFVTLFLGYLDIFNNITVYVFILVIPVLVVCIRDRKEILQKLRAFQRTGYELLSGTYGIKLWKRNISELWKKTKRAFRKRRITGNLLEIIIFFGVIAWIIWFYGWYKLHNVGYSHTDEETHLYWIAELLDGNLFPVGMYPHGVHTLVAVISILTGLTVTRVYLVFCILSAIAIYTAAYLFFRKMFSHIYVALIGWVAVALLDVFHVTSYFRFQSSFPMEFGLVATFGMMYAMFALLRTKEKVYALLFGLSISWSLMAHFYTTILCAVICVCFGLVYGFFIFRKKVLLSFLIAGLAGILLAVLPYGVGYLKGYQFERSIEWALGMATTNQENDVEEEEGAGEETEEEEEELSEEERKEKEEEELLKKQLIDDIAEPLPEEIRERFMSLEVYLAENYASNRTVSAAFLYVHIAMLIVSLGCILVAKKKALGFRWLFFTVLWMVGAVMACAYYLNILVLIEVKRMATFLMFFTIPMFGFGAEILCRVVKRIGKVRVTYVIVLVALAELILIVKTDSLREERFYEITISEGDMLLSLDLVENRENFKWTVVSPTNDLSVVRYDGYHYEILDLINEIDKGAKALYIPTPEVYVVIEHKPTSYVDSKRKIDRSDVAEGDHAEEISYELALTEIDFETQFDELHGADAPYYYQRPIVMSKLYYWMENIKDVYASHVSEYYRDEQVVVYKIEQDPYFLLNLALDYKSAIE